MTLSRLSTKDIDDLARSILHRLNGLTDAEVVLVLQRVRKLCTKKGRPGFPWKHALGRQMLAELQSGVAATKKPQRAVINELWRYWHPRWPSSPKQLSEKDYESIERGLRTVKQRRKGT